MIGDIALVANQNATYNVYSNLTVVAYQRK